MIVLLRLLLLNMPVVIILCFEYCSPIAFILGPCLAILWCIWQTWPRLRKETVGFRLEVMQSGRELILWGIRGSLLVLPCWLLLAIIWRIMFFADEWLLYNFIWGIASSYFTLLNGTLRVICTSRRLKVGARVVVICCFFIPVVNLFTAGYAARRAGEEYDHECYKAPERWGRVQSSACQTRYPIVLVHGVGFRDLKYWNYWGRIPRELTRAGATVYYGNQEAWGTIATNGEDIRRRILEITAETGCEKVNIIAHSKGGLDSRYAISCLGIADSVASLTTLSSPHRGCPFADRLLATLSDKTVRRLAAIIDRTFTKMGDKTPDFYTAAHQFSTIYAEEFNQAVPDMPGIYYQSYASAMSSAFSDFILTVPYLLMKPEDGPSDGLVTNSSAVWGDFQGVFTNKRRRGISHGDIIDLRREDYKFFDVVEAHAGIVTRLKELGF